MKTTKTTIIEKPRYLALAGLLGALALGIAGCTIRGGGWLTSLFTGEKATFAFNGTAVETEDGVVLRGQGDYQDRIKEGEGTVTISVHLDSTEQAIARCVESFESEEEFEEFFNEFFFGFVQDCLDEFDYTIDPDQSAVAVGEYSFQSPRIALEDLNVTGCFALFVADGGQPGPGPGDFFAIALRDPDEGVWYFNCGIVGGGNIVVEDGITP
jgi:hypothetical protein